MNYDMVYHSEHESFSNIWCINFEFFIENAEKSTVISSNLEFRRKGLVAAIALPSKRLSFILAQILLY